MDLNEAARLFDRGTNLYDSKNYEGALRVLRQALEKTEGHLDANSRISKVERKRRQDFVLQIWDWCAMAMHEAKRHEEAVVANNRNLSVRLKSPDYGTKDEDTLETRRRLRDNYSALGQHDNAIAECRVILESVDDSDSRNDLAQHLFKKGDVASRKEAVNINHYTLTRDEPIHGRSHFPLCKARYNLGVELYKLGKYEDARAFLQDNAAILKETSRSVSLTKHAELLRDTEQSLASCNAQLKKKEIEKKKEAREEEGRRKQAHLEWERLENERAEQESQRRERAEADAQEKRRLENEATTRERLHRAQRLEEEQLNKERQETERIEKERLEAERIKKERIENRRLKEERLEKVRLENVRLEKVRIEYERSEQERIAKEHLEKEQRARERLRKERLAKARIEAEKAEKARIETECIEAERIERERIEEDRIEAERIERERIEEDRIEAERIEKERVEKEQAEKEQAEKERPEEERIMKAQRDETERFERELEEKREQEVRQEEEERRAALIQRVKDARDGHDRRLQTRSWSGWPQTSNEHILTPELEQYGDSAALETLCRYFESQTRDWDLHMKFALTPGSFPVQESEWPEEEKHTRHGQSNIATVLPKPTSDAGCDASQRPAKRSTSQPIAQAVLADYTAENQANATVHRDDILADPNNQCSHVPVTVYDHDGPVQLVSKSQSIENLRLDAPDQLRPGHVLMRSASVGSRDRSRFTIEHPPDAAVSRCAQYVCSQFNGALLTSPRRTKADIWFKSLGDTAHRILDKYNGFIYDEKSNGDTRKQRGPYEKVKIAVLDTGAAQSAKPGTPEIIRKSKARIKWRKFEGSILSPREDEDGHGTQVASIILQVTPFAQLFVYRVVKQRTDHIQPSVVAAAIEDAVKAGVDIINMSFGWDQESGEGHEQLRAALRKCSQNDVLVFAATSNDDLESESGMAYPARDDRVIAIDAASARGEWLPFNPSRDNEFKTHRFTALGQGIKTDFPTQLDTQEGWKRMDGTSAATPVAAGIAALVLEFARQPPLGYAPKVAELLKRPEAMREVLAGVVAVRHSKNGEYRHLVPTRLFKIDWEEDDADDWHSSKGHRRRAVDSITTILGKKYGHEIVDPMHDRIHQEWERIAIENMASR
jgi:subtilisin family serine protease